MTTIQDQTIDPSLPANTTAEEDRQSAGRRLADKTVAPRTTAEEDRMTAGQRWVNRLWEVTQAVIAVTVTIAEIVAAFKGIESKTLDAGFFAIIAMYLARTNHTKIGGVSTNYNGR